MYIAVGNIETLIDWFQKDNYQFKFLCLLICGHLNDKNFFTEVFENREALDVISGHEIALFLFSNRMNELLEFDFGYGSYKVLPGNLLLPNRDQRWRYRRISELNLFGQKVDSIRDEVISTSQTIASSICETFNIQDEETPCILLFAKGEPNPFVVQTKGEADVRLFVKFLEDIRDVAKKLPVLFDLDWSIDAAKQILRSELKNEEEKSIANAEKNLVDALEDFHVKLQEYGVPKDVSGKLIDKQTAKQVWQVLGLYPKEEQTALARTYATNIQKAIEEGNLKKNARRIVRSKKELDVLIQRSREVRNRLRRSFSELNSAQELIDRICKTYEKKFTWKARRRPVMQFVETILGVSNKANELLSLEQKIRQLTKL